MSNKQQYNIALFFSEYWYFAYPIILFIALVVADLFFGLGSILESKSYLSSWFQGIAAIAVFAATYNIFHKQLELKIKEEDERRHIDHIKGSFHIFSDKNLGCAFHVLEGLFLFNKKAIYSDGENINIGKVEALIKYLELHEKSFLKDADYLGLSEYFKEDAFLALSRQQDLNNLIIELKSIFISYTTNNNTEKNEHFSTLLKKYNHCLDAIEALSFHCAAMTKLIKISKIKYE